MPKNKSSKKNGYEQMLIKFLIEKKNKRKNSLLNDTRSERARQNEIVATEHFEVDVEEEI